MNLSFGISIAVMLVGFVLHMNVAPGAHPKWSETGRIMFAVGLFITLLRFAGSASLHIG